MEDAPIDYPNRPSAPITYPGYGDKIDAHILIEEVRKRSEIWDRRLLAHSNQPFVRQAWKSISDLFGVPALHLKKKWKNLRDQFGVEIAKPYPSRWAHFDSLIFLNGFVKPREKQDGKQDRPAYTLSMNFEEESDPLAFSPKEEIKDEINDSSSSEEKFDPGKVKVVTNVTSAITPVQSVLPLVTGENRFDIVDTGMQPATIMTSQAFNSTNFGVTPTMVNVGSVSLPGQPMTTGAFNPFRFVAVGPGMLPQTMNTQAFDPTKFGVVNVGSVSLAQSMTTQTFNANNFRVVNVGTASPPEMINTQEFDPTNFVAVASTSLPSSNQSINTQMINSAKFGLVNVSPISLPAQSTTTETFDATKFGVNVRPVSLPQSASLPTTNTFSTIKVLSAHTQKSSVPPILPASTEKTPGAVAVAKPTPRVQPVTAEIVDCKGIRTYGTNPDPLQKKKPRLNMDDLVPKLRPPNEEKQHTTRECVDLTMEDNSTENENDDNFFRSLLPHVRKIPMHLKLRFRNRVHELVEEFAYPEVRKS